MLTTSIELDQYEGKIIANIFPLGSDYIIILQGPGEHLGAVSLGESYERKAIKKEYSASVSTITTYGHRDNKITESLAYTLSKNLKKNFLVIGGIHLDQISKNQLKDIIEKINSLSSKIIEKLSMISSN